MSRKGPAASARSGNLPSRFWHLTSWIPLAISLVTSAAQAQIPESEYAQRRAAVAERMRDGFMVVEGAREPEHDYEDFIQDPNFLYLTGMDEPGAALVVVKQGATHSATLFVQPRDPAREVWSGIRLGVTGATARTGLPARPYTELNRSLDSLARTHAAAYVHDTEGAIAAQAQRARRTISLQPFDAILRELRGVKSEAELDLIRKAAAITVDALVLAMRSVSPGMNEFEIEAVVEYTFRRNGADRPAFSSIIGSGPNTTILHYQRNDRFMNAGELLVMDVGASYRGYAADVTRTVPVSGTFTKEQREIYAIVREAQAAAERAAKPGAPAVRLNWAVDSVITRGLAALGLIESPGATYDCGPGGSELCPQYRLYFCGSESTEQCPQYRLYYMHGLGHAIGLDVHDPGTSGVQPGRFVVGDAFTLEPGVYVRANLIDILPPTARNDALKQNIANAVRRYANIGIRIEDDYIITPTGVEWVSRAPREIEDIEAVMADRVIVPRDPAKIEWYRATASPLARTRPR